MGIEFGDVHTKPKKPKATVHKNGRVGFNGDAAEVFGLSGDETFCLAHDEAEGAGGDLYLLKEVDQCPEKSKVEVAKAGGYFYVNLRRFFERNGVLYEEVKIIYDLKEIDTSFGPAVHLDKREEERPRK